MHVHPNESALVAAAQAGDRAALGQLLMHYADALERRLKYRLPRSLARVTSVDDILQLTYADVFRDVQQFQPRGEGSFFAWIDTIAQRRLHNAVTNASRQKRGGAQAHFDPPAAAETSVRDLLGQVAGDDATASRLATQHEMESALNVAIGQLPDDYREVIRLRFFEGLDLAGTAAAMGKTSAAIRALTDRAKQRLREALAEISG